MLKYMQISESPTPIWIAEGTAQPSHHDSPVKDLFGKLVKEEKTFPLYRGVEIARLGRILTTGVDVEPSDAPIFVSDIDKAWEYPDWSSPRAIFALRANALERSYKLLPRDASPEQIADVTKDYPNQYETERNLWFSRFRDSHFGYEMEYGYWVPGNARKALVAIFLFGNDTRAVFNAAKAALEDWRESMPAEA